MSGRLLDVHLVEFLREVELGLHDDVWAILLVLLHSDDRRKVQADHADLAAFGVLALEVLMMCLGIRLIVLVIDLLQAMIEFAYIQELGVLSAHVRQLVGGLLA